MTQDPIRPSTTDHPLHDAVVAAIRDVYDPEIPINIYDLGLIYTIEIDGEGMCDITMTLTAPGCPVAGEMPGWVAEAAGTVDGIEVRMVELVWEPAWGIERMTEEAQLELGLI